MSDCECKGVDQKYEDIFEAHMNGQKDNVCVSEKSTLILNCGLLI